MTEHDKTARALILELVRIADHQRMTGEEQDALIMLQRMTWRWEREDRD